MLIQQFLPPYVAVESLATSFEQHSATAHTALEATNFHAHYFAKC